MAKVHLVPWLSQLSDATRTLLSSDGVIPNNQMHLYEFLSCVATAVQDPVARANFIGGVLSSAIETIESPAVQECIASVPALLDALGCTESGLFSNAPLGALVVPFGPLFPSLFSLFV